MGHTGHLSIRVLSEGLKELERLCKYRYMYLTLEPEARKKNNLNTIILNQVISIFIFDKLKIQKLLWNMQTGWWAPQQHPCRTQWMRSWFLAWDSNVRCIGLIHSFLWQRWLTSRLASGNCDLVSLISTIRATRCTFSTLLPSTGQTYPQPPIAISTNQPPVPIDTYPREREREEREKERKERERREEREKFDRLWERENDWQILRDKEW